ncbi:Class II Aminoacyl-tRNA synthetase/Biotinyl protein ligase (BPL) and lipoyl protein ligase (LPL) [Septoria linicola]|uniref:proline--tRNA ligase n=1 Tax=Septoria linicola TaxID=215465 RepID=A0A9Q9AHP1_9PEZI|nr:Class II Aminoacyl-tRNA synthetase/Biotinyl protein ligase (BPL) and lipoyl protein ligase (LPL) [Septoria linicola]
MSACSLARSVWRCDSTVAVRSRTAQRRALHVDGRNRLSNFWAPTQAPKKGVNEAVGEDGHDLLLRAGFIRQAQSGIFHLLPLGLRVLEKVERLIDKHMQSVGASKVSLSSLSAAELWEKSGRLDGRNKELFQLQDRKEARFLLAPTHEEEMTTIVKNAVHSYKDLPLRLYQITRKYRDEARPRQGLLRGREFVMKDLYTFDVTSDQAMETYRAVSKAYRGFLDELNLPYLVATADSGNMGGTHSHEYHFVSPKGEDTIIKCDSCSLSMNEEVCFGKHKAEHSSPETSYTLWSGRTTEQRDGRTRTANLVNVYLPQSDCDMNPHALKKVVPGIESSPYSLHDWYDESREFLATEGLNIPSVLNIRDPRVRQDLINDGQDGMEVQTAPFLLTKIRAGDPCPSCDTGRVHLHQAVEIGHTFHLGTRYSKPLEATVQAEDNTQLNLEMGCHGIGVSRLIGAAASLLADQHGLNWPLAITPYSILLVGAGKTPADDVRQLYDTLMKGLLTQFLSGPRTRASAPDAVIDDRDRPFGWKLNDADLIGYPFIVVLGKAWSEENAVELQCRRLGVKETVPVAQLAQRVTELSEEL